MVTSSNLVRPTFPLGEVRIYKILVTGVGTFGKTTLANLLEAYLVSKGFSVAKVDSEADLTAPANI